MKPFLITLFLSIAAFGAQAQKIIFEPGYIVNDKGDTLKGEVKYNAKKEQDCYNKVFFKDATGAQKSYNPKKVKAYGFKEQNFVSMDFEGEPKFYKVLVTGDINMYKMMIEMISMNQPVLGGTYYISRKESPDKLTEVKEGKFKKQMTEWMKDDPEAVSNYEDEKNLNEANATEAIKKYNARKAGQ